MASSAGPKPETLNAWDEYIRGVSLRTEQEVGGNGPFLWIDQDPLRAARERGGEILAGSPFGANNPQSVPYGLIHDWTGAVFIPGAALADVFAVVRDYDRYSEFYRPTVADAALLCRKDAGKSGQEERFRIRYFQKVLFVNETLESEYEAHYIQLNARRWYSITQSTRLQETRDQGGAGASDTLTSGSRYVWRIYSISRYEQRDGGVYLEQENIVLSRAIPNSLRWLVEPAIRMMSRDVVVTTLRQTREAVRSIAQQANQRGNTQAQPARRSPLLQ
jgi:hypothetical protein